MFQTTNRIITHAHDHFKTHSSSEFGSCSIMFHHFPQANPSFMISRMQLTNLHNPDQNLYLCAQPTPPAGEFQDDISQLQYPPKVQKCQFHHPRPNRIGLKIVVHEKLKNWILHFKQKSQTSPLDLPHVFFFMFNSSDSSFRITTRRFDACSPCHRQPSATSRHLHLPWKRHRRPWCPCLERFHRKTGAFPNHITVDDEFHGGSIVMGVAPKSSKSQKNQWLGFSMKYVNHPAIGWYPHDYGKIWKAPIMMVFMNVNDL